MRLTFRDQTTKQSFPYLWCHCCDNIGDSVITIQSVDDPDRWLHICLSCLDELNGYANVVIRLRHGRQRKSL